ncbi:carboxymuconolactone decarboxylase family protein [Roseimaritima ulvae]|uniref:Carboxymuconolactone decarboxylase family protein n=1 Tax=Roseimaritima ulvae TaxID=980254 RepID=A0A5B9QPD9_9BACT|nr:peroxidase-related enzyme [Roseimaritima ulvae]QEG40888.1 Carboxymuconolactone decarboxylase family protein [Roseimaritima ulvae]
MSRIPQISPATATGTTAELFAAVKGKLGMVPNMMQAIGNSSAALNAYLQFSGSLAGGSLSNQQREQIALAVGEANHCDYCLAAHSALGKMAGLSPEQIRDARRGQAVASESDALLRFAAKLVSDRGHVTNEDLQALRSQGFSDSDITEVVANVALNIFTNYFNHVADTDIDFPQAECLACDAA